MASAGDIHSILYRGDVLNKQFQPKFDPSKKVKRHFPGQAPEYVSEKVILVERVSEDGSGDESEFKQIQNELNEDELNGSIESILADTTVSEEARPVKRRRREIIEQVDPLDLIDQKRESFEFAPLKLDPGPPGLAQEGEPTVVDRREKIKLRALEERRKEEEQLDESIREVALRESLTQMEEDEDESEDEEEEDLDVVKPIFIPAALRESFKEKQAVEIEESEEAERQKQELEERKRESRNLFIECVQLEEQEEKLRASQPTDFSLEPTEMPDDNDTIDEESEYQLWKIRELKRIKRDKEEEESRFKEQEQIERRRQMTNEERREDDRRLDAKRGDLPKKGKYAFLQKYYHKGAFFQDLAASGSESLYLRDFNQCVGEDAIDKKILPKPMQVRRGQFGKAGQVKHTHLAAEDTTDFSSAWVQISRHNTKLQEKMAGLKGANQLDRPSAKPADEQRESTRGTSSALNTKTAEQKRPGTVANCTQNDKKYDFAIDISRREKSESQYYEKQIDNRGLKYDTNKEYRDGRHDYYVSDNHNNDDSYSMDNNRERSDRGRERFDRNRERDGERDKGRERTREPVDAIRNRDKDWQRKTRDSESGDRERERAWEREKGKDYKSGSKYDRHYR